MDFTPINAAGKDLPKSAKKFQVIRNNKTGLYWAVARSPKELAPNAADAWCEQLDLCGFTWRCPTIEERLSINDYSRHSPALDTAAFGKTPKSGWEWTSTKYAPAPAYRWCVSLGNGYTLALHSYHPAFARAVRAG